MELEREEGGKQFVCVCVLCISDFCCGGPGSPMGVLDGMEYDQLYTIH
jgi:hypothetical protein